jgi:UDP-2-acetamido-2-deoxy-ribo-hexuluronate aminotransferase
MIPFIDLKPQYSHLKKSINERISTVLEHGQYIMGPEVVELEEKLAAYVGVKHCIAVSSGTDSLLIAMMALGIKPDDEVITTPFSFIATGETISLLGATPVFVDINQRSYNIDPANIEAAITDRTRAIIPVGLFGQCADMDAINTIADRFKLPVIEDAAQSFGSSYKDKRSCGLSTIGSTSFYPSKPLGCYGDGGALFTNEDELAKSMSEIRLHGQSQRYHHHRIGINGRMDTLQAAILLAKLERFDWEIQRRQEVAERYNTLFSEQNQIKVVTPEVEPFNLSVYAQYTIEVQGRDALASSLKSKGVPTAVHYPIPLHMQSVFSDKETRISVCPHAEAAAKRVISLPMGPDLKESDQLQIVSFVLDSLKQIEDENSAVE